MPRFPSLEWCRAVEAVAVKDPAVPAAAREWGGDTVGVVIARGEGMPRDFCLFIKPHPAELRADLKLCEDEDDLELEEPKFLFRVPIGICRAVLERQLDPLDVLRQGQVRVNGDLKRLITYGTKHRAIGEAAVEKVETTF